MSSYLVTWNPNKGKWPNLYEDWQIVQNQRLEGRWSVGNTQRIEAGDRVFLMRLGVEPKGIMASGVVTSGSYEDEHWDDERDGGKAWYVKFVYDALLNPETQFLLDPLQVSARVNWFSQSSGISIDPVAAKHLEEAWHFHLVNQGMPIETDEFYYEMGYVEGKAYEVKSTNYERNRNARKKCIEHHGAVCCICGMDFGERYGEIGEGFIHVHHLIPISDRGQEYVVDPIRDLRPVCPNCHAMLHQTRPPLSIGDLTALLRD